MGIIPFTLGGEEALQWHQSLTKSMLTREWRNWEEYIRALSDRFGVLLYDDPMPELMNLKQTGEHVCNKRRQLYIMEIHENYTDEGDTGDKEVEEEERSGTSREKAVHILIDTGSTHNLFYLQATKRLGCKLEATTPFPVAVADGSFDVVLGVQQLITLGDIKWNFSQLRMDLMMKGQ
ncbi:hypothetical protein BUALT_Bualt01G0112900 [Buddleja alternifolia]|uniref:Uncharacterized protein n=1 Tax=Buddleja alternifolia TaxID=168488 RepID=A0AAV6YCT4_9LAMI|nr:hypothetical protein BUALT_Bualt01G0112900 [Buddleja alternifolia]